jgi:hypothetical protein
MHYILIHQIDEGLYLKENRDLINRTFAAKAQSLLFRVPMDDCDQQNFEDWTAYIYDFEYNAMIITYLMYMTWMFTFQHIYEAVFAAKNKRVVNYVLFDNILDFWIMFMGMIYITVVYKVYRWNTFINRPSKEEEAMIFWENWDLSTEYFPD